MFRALALAAVSNGFLSAAAMAGVEPILQTEWGQGGVYKTATPLKDGQTTYPGCTTIASAQILNHYRYQDHANSEVGYVLDHPLTGPDVDGRSLYLDLTAHSYDWQALDVPQFIYHVGVTLNAQFGGGQGSSATGKQIENAFRYQWGYNQISRRKMFIIMKDAFGYSDNEWADLIRAELDAGRPVMHMAQQVDADQGHAFVLDGYRNDGTVHVNWGWGGHGNGWYDPNTLVDPSGRSWTRDAMIFLGLEPTDGFAASLAPAPTETRYAWNGNGSLISYASGTATGYGLTVDEALIHPEGTADPVVFFQWEIDGRDGTHLKIDADGVETATVTYGPWNDRGVDRTYANVSLPFVLDPARDGLSIQDQEYYVIAVTTDRPTTDRVVSAQITTAAATIAKSMAAMPILLESGTWAGNGSVIDRASGSTTGYGLTLDEGHVAAGTEDAAVFFQWEIDASNGQKLKIEGDGTARVTYGSWASRLDDVTRDVTLPWVLDPAADGLSNADGEYYTIRVQFAGIAAEDLPVVATAVR